MSASQIDRHVVRTWFSIAFERSLGELIQRGDIARYSDSPLSPFGILSEYVRISRPTMLLVTRLPYAEHQLSGLLLEHQELESKEGSTIEIEVIPFREYQVDEDLNRLSHRLASTGAITILGCGREYDVPDSIRRHVDLQIDLRPVEREVFAELFHALFDAPLPDEYQNEDTSWFSSVEPTDLQQPLRMEFSSEDAARYIKDRTVKRLSRILPESGPGLDELRGMGHAKAIANDLINDIRSAQAGSISWDEVDRGFLLVGPPGTGKTSLARAIARECGIKFVSTSASDWQAVENLGQHLGKIRRSFDEAKHNQPAILFIDELDSIGNRETFSDSMRMYQTPVVNYLLKELDGFEGREKLVVIGATNHQDNVDPALQRSGRLDQVIQISYPNNKALEHIYRYYLLPYMEGSFVGEDIRLDDIAQLSIGLTGADIEKLVRGAARRARRKGGLIEHDDLLSEILRKPRRPDVHQPFDADMLKRLAVHMAGHALIRMIGNSKGSEIKYVSILPRSDGRSGALVTDREAPAMMTRGSYKEKIVQYLAGRAAEEIYYGKDGISDLSGNYGSDSDLAKATRTVESMQGLSGLGEESQLLWWNVFEEEKAPYLKNNIEKQLCEIYGKTVDEISRNRDVLGAIVKKLIESQEIVGDDIRTLVLDIK